MLLSEALRSGKAHLRGICAISLMRHSQWLMGDQIVSGLLAA